MAMTKTALDGVFAEIERRAVAGERAPMNSTVQCPSGATSRLAREGRILVEVFAHNWRRITILTGPHAGKATKPTPYKGSGAPYKIIDKHGTRVNGRIQDAGAAHRQQPWSPSLSKG